VQIILTFVAIFIVLQKLELEQIINTIKSSNLLYVFFAFISFNISKIISSIRLNRFFLDVNLRLTQKYNLMLYYLGMFYNLFFLGGISGDAYKIYIFKKHFNQKILSMTKILLLDRVSGLIALLFLTGVLFLFSTFSKFLYIKYLVIFEVVAIYPITIFIYKYKFKEFLNSFNITNSQALLVQIFQLLCAYFIIISFTKVENLFDLLVIFLISSILAVLPLTIGGLGARELTFVYFLGFINKNATIGVSLCVLFFLITVISSFIGVVFINKDWSSKQ